MRRLPLRSPPRMRGKVHPAHHAEQGDGITPAYAGKSRCNLPSTAPWKDHPRVCGEKASPMMKPAPPLGSPPRVRGKAKKRCRSCPLTRITPAYAGKRPAASAARSAKWDHPRVCGEKFRFILLSLLSSGSPPRVRGKAGGCRTAAASSGITPAYAGKSVIRISDGCLRRDHPRVCGEKAHLRKMSCLLLGSPPRMRGKGRCHHPVIFVDRITPACAGKSICALSRRCAQKDHPRVCGEKLA